MSTDYNSVLERLKQERVTHRMSQEELGSMVRITQGHYSKVENAIKRFTYYEVKSLAETKLDLYYIYTGKRAGQEYYELFGSCSYRELCGYLGMAATLFTCMYEEKKLALERSVYERACCLKYIAGAVGNTSDNIFPIIRRFRKMTQAEMASQLGMDIKKYRELERGIILPDSELIWKICAMYGVPPAVVVNDTNGLVGEIGYLLDQMEERQRSTVLEYFRLLRDFYASL